MDAVPTIDTGHCTVPPPESPYLAHYGLRRAPFRLTAAGAFYTGAGRGEALAALAYALRAEDGLILLTGEVGTGKTTVLRALLSSPPPGVRLAYLCDPALTPAQALPAVAAELGLELGRGAASARWSRVQQALVEWYGSGVRAAVLIDEAHRLPPATLERVRLLSNLEGDGGRLLQIVLAGQPELVSLLKRPALRALRDRVGLHLRLRPLATGEVRDYVRRRLAHAGAQASPFTPAALALLARAARGRPRRVNLLADRALLAAYAGGRAAAGMRHVLRAALELRA